MTNQPASEMSFHDAVVAGAALTGAGLAPDRKVMSSSLAILTAVCFGAISALVSFAVDRNVLGGATPRPFKGKWELRGTITPTDSLYQVPAAQMSQVVYRSEA